MLFDDYNSIKSLKRIPEKKKNSEFGWKNVIHFIGP